MHESSGSPRCGICPAPAAKIRSHIIPRGEQRRLMAGDTSFIVTDADPSKKVHEPQNEFWQEYLLCQSCEDRCGTLDAYFATFLDSLPPMLSSTHAKYPRQIRDVNCETLLQFLLSVALRAHASTRRHFSLVDLGDDLGVATKAFLQNDAVGYGLRFLALLPKLDGASVGFRCIPFYDSPNRFAVMWLGSFRFSLAFPGAALQAIPTGLVHPNGRRGLLVHDVDIRNFKEFSLFIETEKARMRDPAHRWTYPKRR